MNNPERVDRIRKALGENQWDLLVCALPMNVLLLSGYWPVVGTGVAVASSDGRISLLVPEDEEDLAKRGWADEVRTFKAGSLDELTTPAKAIHSPLRKLAESFSAGPRRDVLEARGFGPQFKHSTGHGVAAAFAIATWQQSPKQERNCLPPFQCGSDDLVAYR